MTTLLPRVCSLLSFRSYHSLPHPIPGHLLPQGPCFSTVHRTNSFSTYPNFPTVSTISQCLSPLTYSLFCITKTPPNYSLTQIRPWHPHFYPPLYTSPCHFPGFKLTPLHGAHYLLPSGFTTSWFPSTQSPLNFMAPLTILVSPHYFNVTIYNNFHTQAHVSSQYSTSPLLLQEPITFLTYFVDVMHTNS